MQSTTYLVSYVMHSLDLTAADRQSDRFAPERCLNSQRDCERLVTMMPYLSSFDRSLHQLSLPPNSQHVRRTNRSAIAYLVPKHAYGVAAFRVIQLQQLFHPSRKTDVRAVPILRGQAHIGQAGRIVQVLSRKDPGAGGSAKIGRGQPDVRRAQVGC